MTLRSSLIAALLLASAPALADGLDRDTLLTDAPATPNSGTIRITGAGGSQTQEPGETSSVSANILWSPFHHFAADVGGYWQGGEIGPSVRARYQLLSQDAQGVDLAAGLRFKTVGFSPDEGELELVVALGKSFGSWDAVLDLVGGTETGGPGKDIEAKVFVGYRFSDPLRLGIDGRLQAEVFDENGGKVPGTEDLDLVVGPAVSWLITPKLQLQALVGVAKPHLLTTAAATGLLQLSYDF